LIERNFDTALEKAALVVRPDEKPFSWNLNDDWKTGWWLMKELEEAGFGNKVQVKSVDGRSEASTLDELVGNMLFFKDSKSSLMEDRYEYMMEISDIEVDSVLQGV
jgi:hypothetical protein